MTRKDRPNRPAGRGPKVPLSSHPVLRQSVRMQLDRERLGRYVLTKRRALGYLERKPFADAINLSDKTIGRLERGERVGPTVFADIERFFGWRPGDCDRIMRGGEPTSDATDAHARREDSNEQLVDAVADLVRLLGKDEAGRYLTQLVARASDQDRSTASGE